MSTNAIIHERQKRRERERKKRERRKRKKRTKRKNKEERRKKRIEKEKKTLSSARAKEQLNVNNIICGAVLKIL
ncbi:MAG: hypothetical protein U0L03_02780 [Succinivibrionaceae bacterium]|nr:hypothetical protein [Succinivibrionaceae bacterium]